MPGPAVSDHALLRFLEAGGRLNVEQLRTQLETSLARAGNAAAEICSGEYWIHDGELAFLVREDVVVTVWTRRKRREGERLKALRRKPKRRRA